MFQKIKPIQVGQSLPKTENFRFRIVLFDGTQTDEVKQWTYGGEKRRPESIWLKPGVKHAIITGNNGYNGISVRNEIGAKAIIRDNEDPVKEKTK